MRVSHWFNIGWEWFQKDLGTNVLVGLLATLFVSLGWFLVTGPVAVGLALVGLRLSKGEDASVRDFFDGFDRFLPALVASVLITCLVAVGLLFLIIPGLVIFTMYIFTFHFMAEERGIDFWQAMERSRNLVAQDYIGFTLFTCLLIVINLLGVLFFGAGIILTLPVTSHAVTAAYLELTAAAQE